MNPTTSKFAIRNGSKLHQFAIMAVAAVVVLALDQLTKLWVVANVAERPPISVIPGFLRLRYTENTGAAFGFFQGWTGLLSVAAIAIIVAIVLSATRVAANSLGMVALGLVTGGALGNLVDRLRLGYVVDFVDVYGPRISLNNLHYTFPVFNVADSAITVGAILLIGTIVFGKDAPQPPPIHNSPSPGTADTPHPLTASASIMHPKSTTPALSAPVGWAGLFVMLAGLLLMAFRQASKRL